MSFEKHNVTFKRQSTKKLHLSMWWDCKDSKMDAELERLAISIFTPTVPETILQKQSTGSGITRYWPCYVFCDFTISQFHSMLQSAL